MTCQICLPEYTLLLNTNSQLRNWHLIVFGSFFSHMSRRDESIEIEVFFLSLTGLEQHRITKFLDAFLGPPSGARHRNSLELQSLKPNYEELLCGVLPANGRSTYLEKPIFPRARLTPG